MKIFLSETKYKNPKDKSTTITFRIVGERKADSMEVPLYESTVRITKEEESATEKVLLDKIASNNAMQVFEKFYQANFSKNE